MSKDDVEEVNMDTQFIDVRAERGAAYITLNRPPLNVMTIQMLEELCVAARWAVEEKAHIIVINSEGKAFSAGVDVGDHEESKIAQAAELFSEVFSILRSTTKPIVSVVDGHALGGGCELALFADVVIASERSKFGQPEITVGALASIACYMLPKMLTRQAAFDMLLRGTPITAQRAYGLGLVSAVFPVDGFAEAADDYISRLTSLSPLLLEKTKKAILSSEGLNWDEGIKAIDAIYVNEVTPSWDAHEGIAAFLEKRQPVWRGC